MSASGIKVRLFCALGVAFVVATSAPAAAAALRQTGQPSSDLTPAEAPSAYAPALVFTKAAQLSARQIPINVFWPEASPDGGPIARYELQRSFDSGAWTNVPLTQPLARYVTIRISPWTDIRFRVRAIGNDGVAGNWAESTPAWISVAQEKDQQIAYSGSWSFVADKNAYGKKRAWTSTGGSSATFTFVGRQVTWISRIGPDRGQATVSLDGGRPEHIDLGQSTTSSRRIVYRASWPTQGLHTLTVTATSAGAYVDVDGFVVAAHPAEATLIGAGDISVCTNNRDSATAALVKDVLDADASAIAYTVGDNVYPDGSPANFANCYEPTWGSFKARTRPVVGNHEYQNNPGAAGYFAYFGGNAGVAGQGWYRYEAGTWRVYVLNSECAAGTACYYAQVNWLKNDLAAEPHRCVMAMWHRPLFSTGDHGNSSRMSELFKLLFDKGADLVIVGHDHGYQRFAPADVTGTPNSANGMRQIVVGTGGANLYPWETDSALLEVRDNTTHGVLRLDLTPGAYAWQFLPIPGPTGFTDSGTTDCH